MGNSTVSGGNKSTVSVGQNVATCELFLSPKRYASHAVASLNRRMLLSDELQRAWTSIDLGSTKRGTTRDDWAGI